MSNGGLCVKPFEKDTVSSVDEKSTNDVMMAKVNIKKLKGTRPPQKNTKRTWPLGLRLVRRKLQLRALPRS